MGDKLGIQQQSIYQNYTNLAYKAAALNDPNKSYFWGAYAVGLKANPGLTLKEHQLTVDSFTA